MAAHILVLSPDEMIAEVIAEALDLEGYGVTHSVYRDQMPEAAQETSCDLLLFDYGGGAQPPGAALLPAVQNLLDHTAAPLVIITTNPATLDDQMPWIQSEGIPLLPAPFLLDALLDVVQAALARSRSRLAKSRTQLTESQACIARSQARIAETETRLYRSPPAGP
jgi:DNA-binding response OmpR family regulator